MKKFMLLFSLLMILPIISLAQPGVIQTFDAEIDTSYMHYADSDNADSTKAFINRSLETSEVYEGAGAIKLEYSIHNIEGWGGFSKIEHIRPDSQVFNWSEYDSISFWYFNSVKQSLENRVELRFNIFDVSDVPDSTDDPGNMEFYYSFHKVLDNEPGWNEIKIILEDGRGNPEHDEWGGDAFNRTGWNGVAGNDKLDKDKIKGFAFEFSISGSGDGDFSAGTIILDHLTLKGSLNELTINSGFEDGLTGWDTAQGGGYIEVKSEGAYAGNNYCEIGVNDNAWAVAFYDSIPAVPGNDYQLSAFIKDLSAEDLGASYAALKLEAKRADNSLIIGWEDIIPGITSDWANYSTHHIMPAETHYISAVLVATKWSGDGMSAAYGFDDVLLIDMGIADTTAPEIVQNVKGIPDAPTNTNAVIWDLVAEEDETYTVYASQSPITDIAAPGVEKLGTTVDDKNSFLHRLIYPVNDHELTYYYAVTCTDDYANTGPAGVSAAVVNTAKGSPAISLNPPAGFAADGDLTEWFNSDIMPFEFSKTLGTHVAVGDASTAFDDDDDMTITGYIAMDDDYLYLAFDIVDNVYSYDAAGNFWEDDMFEVYIGLYNMTEKHKSYLRGPEPDYKFVVLNDDFSLDIDGTSRMMTLDDPNFEFINFGARDWAVEAKVSLDSLTVGDGAGDTRFHPQRGMKIPLDLVFHDSDATNSRDGSYSYSPNNFDNSHQSPLNWYHTWIGDTDKVVVTAIDDPISTGVAKEFKLEQNYPNPFNPETKIRYTVPASGKVSLTVYNVVGQKIATLVNAKQNAGQYTIQFNGAELASGVYFYRLEAKDHMQVRKMLLVK